jgi:hypothetical protein
MPDIEHPAIERMSRFGYLGTISQDDDVETCKSCDATLSRGDTVVEFQDLLFCNKECLTEAFADNPERFGATTITKRT